MPHAPVLIPAVGGGRETEAESSVTALRNLSRRVLALTPRRMALISPHSPRRPGAFGIWETQRLSGSLDQFGCPRVAIDLPNDPDLIAAVKTEAASRSVPLWEIRSRALDHGAIVPLYFLVEAGWSGPTMVLSLNYPGEGNLEELGQSLAAAAERVGGPMVVVASGDMSHRLRPGAPAGYDPKGKKFDETFVRLLRSAQYGELSRIDPELQEQAAEDVVDSTLVALAAVGHCHAHHEVLSYEGPFGVGYCVAVLYQAHETPVAD
jgi:aromatic ring-opening dioxygenase LigB subunit